MRGGSRLFRALHMLNTSNVTSPMPEQCRECHRIVFEPMPIREHDIIPLLPPFLLGAPTGAEGAAQPENS
jgi:hypothetical protein